MTVIKINAITVPAAMGAEVAKRFASRAGAVDGQPGFEGFELLRPTDDREQWLVVTRWADDASFEAWRGSDSATNAHGGGPGGDAGSAGGGSKPMGLSAELWHYSVEVGSVGS